MKAKTSTKRLNQVLATLLTMAARQNHLVQLMKKPLLLLLMLVTGLVAHATIQNGIRMQGMTQNNSHIFVIQSFGQTVQSPNQTGSSQAFSNPQILVEPLGTWTGGGRNAFITNEDIRTIKS